MDQKLHQRCETRFRRLHQAVRRRLVVHGLVTWLAVTGLVLLALVAALGWFEPPRWVRVPLVLLGAVAIVLCAFEALWRPWRAWRTRPGLARRLDRAGKLADTLSAAEEVLRRPDRWRQDTPLRAALVGRLLARTARMLDELALPRLLPVWRPLTVYTVLLLVLAAGTWFERYDPQSFHSGWRSMQAPWQDEAGLAPGSLRLVPAPAVVTAGASLEVAVLDLAGGPEPLVCEVRVGSGYWQPQPAQPVSVPATGAPGSVPYERWQTTLASVTEDLSYRFRRGERVSETGTLEVLHPPLLLHLAARVHPPAYTQLAVMDLPRLPAYLEAPQGSRLELAGQANRPLTSAAVATADQDTFALSVRADSLQGSLSLDAPLQFWPIMRDDRGLEGRSELVYEIVVVPDRLPVVRLQRPDDDGRLPLTSTLRLQAGAEDDYGLIAVDLLLRRGDAHGGVWSADLPTGRPALADDQGWERLPLLDGNGLPEMGRRDVRTSLGDLPLAVLPRESVDAGIRLDLDLQPGALRLVPGDVLELVLEAQDNREPGPPGTSRSAVLRLQVPSSLEILQAREESQSGHQDELAAMRSRSESLSAELERLRRELLRNPVPGWDRRQRLQDAVERQGDLQTELSRLAEAMRQNLESLADNRLTSPQIMEQMDRIAELMSSSRSDGMQELMERMRESLAQMSPKELSLAMEDLDRNQQDMLRRLDAALDMLKNLQREQQLEGLAEMVAEMIRKQEDLVSSQRQAQAEAEADADRKSEAGEATDENEATAATTEADGADPAEAGDQAEAGDDGSEGDQDQTDQQGEASAGDQDQAAESSEASSEATKEDLARQQEALAEELAALEERLQEALDELEASSPAEDDAAAEAMREALSEALQKLQEQQTGQTMQQAGQDMQQDQSDEALANMEQALSELAGLYHVLLKSQMAMQMAMKTEQGGRMRDLAADLLALSQRQEALAYDLPTSLRDVRSDELVRSQNLVLQGAMSLRDGLQKLASAAPREVMQMLERLDDLIKSLGRTLDQLQEGRTHTTRFAAESALGEMNQLVIQLLTQAQMTGQGAGSGSQQPMLSQQLQQMAQEQAGLNALAEQLSRQQGRISQELRAQMQRLQQGQQGLSGRASDLAEEQRRQEQQEGGRLLGDLDQIARDMQSVGDELAGGLVTEEVLRRQERIFSRLLDMHNASRERDWAQRREGRTAEELYTEQTGRSGPETDDWQPDARRWRAVDEAPPAYRDLVRDYFREIQRLHESTGRGPDGQRRQSQELP